MGLEEAGGYGRVEELEQALPIAGSVDEDAGLGVEFQLRPGDGFQNFFQRAIAAGQDKKCVGELDHAGFTLMHGENALKGGEATVSDLAVVEDCGQNSDDLGATG